METNKKTSFAHKLKILFLEPRPQYLLLPVILVFLGSALAWHDGFFNIWDALIAMVGLVLCHMSVNIINDYFDFITGVDLKVERSPFNGGSGILPAGLMKPKHALWYGIICFVLAMPVGAYFMITKGWTLLPILVLGGICILMYTPMILKVDFPEWSPGLGLGILPVLGAYFAQTGFYSAHALIASIPSGLLVMNLLLLNEFPDVEADKIANKRTLPIRIGMKGAAIVYCSATVLVYLWIIAAVVLSWMPVYTLFGLLTLPLAIMSMKGSFHGNDRKVIIPAMANNVLVVLGTQFLIGAGYVVSMLVK